MIIGIDLGTTNSLVAYFSEDGPRIIPNRLGQNLTPSIVSIDENDQIYIGETARERGILYPDMTAQVFKRSMGSTKKYTLGNKQFTPEELSSFILRSLKEDAEHFLGEEITEAVISVPAYFNDKRRKATKQAGELAGLKVERIISEPTAAAVSYGLYDKTKNTKFLVFDLGGGTLDVSVLELFHNILEVRAVAGDNYLGGEDFTEVLELHFLEKHAISLDSLDTKTLVQLHRQAELCKLGFSESTECKMVCMIDGESKELVISIEQYEALCEKLLEKIRKPIQKSLTDAHIKLTDIDVVVLVGGATKLSIIKNQLIKLFRKFPSTNINPDEAVALGAAIQAAMKERNQAVKEVILTDVCSFTLGTEISVERWDGGYETGHFCPIIERNTVIPASRTETFYTVHDNQSKLTIRVLQGESRFAENNLLLGVITVNIPKNKAGEECVEVTYTYDVNSILEVEVKVTSTGEKKKQLIKSQDNELTDEEITQRMQELSYLKIHPREAEENKLLLLQCERLYEESVGITRQQIDYLLREFERALSSQDRDTIDAMRKEVRKDLKQLEEDNDYF